MKNTIKMGQRVTESLNGGVIKEDRDLTACNEASAMQFISSSAPGIAAV